MKWVLWSGTVGLESPLLDRFPAAVAGGYDLLSLSPLDIARAAEQSLSAQDIGRRARDQALVALAEHGTLQPVIDSVSPFMQIVDAHRRVDSGHKVGSVVLRFDHDH